MTTVTLCSATNRKSWLKINFRCALCKNMFDLSQELQSTTSETSEKFCMKRRTLRRLKPTSCCVHYTICLYAGLDRTTSWLVRTSTMFTTQCDRMLWKIRTKTCNRVMNTTVHNPVLSVLLNYFLIKSLSHWNALPPSPIPNIPNIRFFCTCCIPCRRWILKNGFL